MKIISPFADYYDNVQKSGVEYDVVYRRIPLVLKPGSTEVPDSAVEHMARGVPLDWKDQSLGLQFFPGVLYFCGKTYPYVCVYSEKTEAPPVFYYSSESLNTFMAGVGAKRPSGRGFFQSHNAQLSDLWRIELSRDHLHEIAAKQLISFRLDSRAPGSLEVNPKLAAINFAKVVPAPQAFQEIAMYLGSLAAPEPAMVVVSDKSRLLKHGFDGMSFKKSPKKPNY